MRRLLPFLALLLIAGGAGLGWYVFGGFARAQAETFHVNYDRGRDEADGLTAATAWKHAPGDSNAKGSAARTRLRSGDQVLFAPGVRYRGAIQVEASGAEGQPIVFAGETPGGTAIIDGSEPATVRPCASAADCGGAPNWQRLVRIAGADPDTPIFAIFTPTGPLRPAQSPDPKDDFYREEVVDMAEVDGAEMSAGRVKLPHDVAAALASGGGRLSLWVKPNRVVERPILGLEGDVARFDPTGLQYYTDRPARAAVVDHAAVIDRPGEYVMLPGGKAAVALLPAGVTAATVGTGRGGFTLHKAANVVIRDLGFENMADGGQLAPGGVAIFAREGANLVIEKNRFANFEMPMGQGPIIAQRIDHLTIARNAIDTISLGSGMRLGSSQNVTVEDNTIRRIGRTGVMLIDVDHAVVRRNLITDVRGVHGNGLSAYLGNHDISFIANTVLDANQPATFKGAGAKANGDNDILFANNLFVAVPDALGSLISWGADTRGVVIRNNVLLGGKTGLRMSDQDQGLTIADNVVSGMVWGKALPADWKVVGNTWTALSFQQKKLSPPPAVVASLGGAGAELQHGRAPAGICQVIRSYSVGAADANAGVVGASLKCP
jgi:hypothetical protein